MIGFIIREVSAIVNKIFKSIDIKKSDKVLVEDGQRVVKNQPIITRGGEDIASSEIAYAMFKGSQLLLIAQDHKVDIRNGSEVVVKEGEIVAPDEAVAFFDPFNFLEYLPRFFVKFDNFIVRIFHL